MDAVAEPKPHEAKGSPAVQSRHWHIICGLLIAAVVLYLAVDARFDRSFNKNLADGAAYLDISRAIANHSPTALLNTYWSPGYPVALYLGLALLHPSPATELAAVYWIDWGIGVLALCCLIYFLTGLPAPVGRHDTWGLTRPMLVAIGCALLLIAIQSDAPVFQLTPDLLLAAWLWLAGGAFLRIIRRQRIYNYALLGLALALAYFTKVVALPLSALAIVMLPFLGANRKKAAGGALLTLAVIAALITPYIIKLSAAKGRLTYGESGSLNYAWVVDGSDRWELQNDSQHGHARLALTHPARRLMKSPDVYEFASPVEGSFPMFDDPSYWDDGLKPVFYLKGEVWHITMDLYHTASWLARRGEFVIALALLLLLQIRNRVRGPLREVLPVLFWFTCFWGVYLLVDVEDRYVFAILTSILLLAASAIRLPDSANLRRVVTMCAAILVCGVMLRSLDAAGNKLYYAVKQRYVGPAASKAIGPYDSQYWDAAQALANRVGLRPGDTVACMRAGCDSVYWARLAGLRITADIPRDVEYWAASPADRTRAMNALAGVGVKALVTRRLGPGAESEGWIPLGDEFLYARRTY